MKKLKVFTIALLCFCCITPIFSQITQNSVFGGAFTPKGRMNVLVVCVGFGSEYDEQHYVEGWSPDRLFPEHIDRENIDIDNAKAFYTKYESFDRVVTEDDKYNVSRFYYEMSNKQLRLIFTPVRVDVAPPEDFNDIDYETKAKDAFKMLSEQYRAGTFDWQDFDSRINNPTYLSDNSNDSPDNKIDLTIVMFRSNGDGESTAYVPDEYSFLIDGYEITTGLVLIKEGGRKPLGFFIHELGHHLYNGSHYGGGNSVIGPYLYKNSAAWGMMNIGGRHPFSVANAWERWYLGWDEIAVGQNRTPADVSGDFSNEYLEYELRDFATTGDAVRIAVPAGEWATQSLWLENHQGISVYDNRYWVDGVGGSFPVPQARGLFAYVTTFPRLRSDVPVLMNGNEANGIKPLHSMGNYDYLYTGASINPLLWGNSYWNFNEGKPNPYSGQCRWQSIIADSNNNGAIDFKIGANDPGKQEDSWLVKRDGQITYDIFGVDANFPVGAKIGMATNPPLVNMPKYTSVSEGFEPMILNGMEVEVVSQNATTGSITVRVRNNKVQIDKDFRMTGKIHLPDILNNNRVDLNLMPNKTLTINRTGTPNITTKVDGSFFAPSEFTCLPESHFLMSPHSSVVVSEGSTFIIQKDATLQIEDGAVFYVKANSKLLIEDGASIIINGGGRIVVECGGTITTATPTSTYILVLNDVFSCIDLLTGSRNPNSITKTSGNGTINTFPDTEMSITTPLIENNKYYFSKSIKSDANISDSIILKYSAEDYIEFMPGFQVNRSSNGLDGQIEFIINKNLCQ